MIAWRKHTKSVECVNMQILNSYRIRKKKCHLTDITIYALNIEGLFFFWSGYAKLLLLLPVYLVICLGIWNNLPSQIFSLLLLSYMRLLTTNSSICPQTSRCGSQSMLFTATPAWVLPEDRWVVGGGDTLRSWSWHCWKHAAGSTAASLVNCMVLSEPDRTFPNM